MTKLDPVEKLSMELAALISAEEKAVQLIEETEQQVGEIRRERARVVAELRVAAGGQAAGTAKAKAEKKPRAAQKATRKPRASKPTPPAATPQAADAVTDSDKVRNYVRSLAHGEALTPDSVAEATGVRTGLVSTYLSRMITEGEGLLERTPGTKRGRYRAIKQAA